jgi:hypothetical protein
MSLLLWFLAACGSTPTTIGGDAELVIWEVSPFTIDAPGLDAEGKVIEGAKALPVASSAPEIVKVGTDGRLQCDQNGTATITLTLGELKRELPVQCFLVKEVRTRPNQIKAVLTRGPDGSLRGRSLNAVKTEVIDNNSKVMEGVPVAASSSDEGVVKLGEGGRVELHHPGLAELRFAAGKTVATVPIEIGEEVAARADLVVTTSAPHGIPLEPGKYRVTAGADQPISMSIAGTDCKTEPSKEQRLECEVTATGALQIQNGGNLIGRGPDAKVKLRVVRLPTEPGPMKTSTPVSAPPVAGSPEPEGAQEADPNTPPPATP